jgi:phosphoribosylformimino-5-aminoimidazole carboxamide ribotide isomerase
MIIYPAIDLKDGQCVRLVQGDKENKTVYSDTPAKLAVDFQDLGAEYLHVVDLDGAFEGGPRNLKVIKEIAAAIKIPFQVGGGLRNRRDVEKLLAIGAQRVIIGTRAVKNPKFIEELLRSFGPEKIILSIDARDGMVAIEGWVEKSSLGALKFGKSMHNMGIETAIFTDISRDGLLQGPNLASVQEMALTSGLKIIASGGVSTVKNIEALKSMETLGVGVCGAIIGKALYEGKVSLREALKASK